jgi:hypothetical protein
MDIGEQTKAIAKGSDLFSILRNGENFVTGQVLIEIRRLDWGGEECRFHPCCFP